MGGNNRPCPERSSNAVTMQDNCREILWKVSDDSMSAPSEAVSSSIWIRSLSTFMRSLKKSMLTRWANFEMPDSAAGRSGVGFGFFRMRK